VSPEASPLAAIDVGSNTVHLVVAVPTEDGHDLRYLADEVELVRLGADVSATGSIGPERLTRAVAAIRAQAELARSLGAGTVLGIATEGVRAAANARDVLRAVREQAGVTLQLITGEQEAALTYWGAISGTPADDLRRAVLDLGGGSLEVVVGAGDAIHWRVSVPLGSGAIHARYAPSDPPVASELDAAGAAAQETLRGLDLPLPVAEVVVCGGTATTLAALSARALGPANGEGGPAEDTGRPNGRDRSLTRERLGLLLALLQSQPAAELASRYRVDVGRARLLGAGAVVLLAAMERLGVEALRVSKRGIREGALLAYAQAGPRWLELATAGRR
jgi:exopolyphosphatase/pppGpp-phosphohydrolase